MKIKYTTVMRELKAIGRPYSMNCFQPGKRRYHKSLLGAPLSGGYKKHPSRNYNRKLAWFLSE